MERKPTIWYQEKESFTRIRSDSFFVALISEGFAVLMIDGERVFLSAGTMIFMPRGHRLELLASRDLKAQSLSFQPDFLNVNLSWEFIEDDRYPLYCSQFDYPRLGLFYKRNILYAGILPVDANESARIAHAMEEIGSQLLSRPDHLWSCRSRSLLFGLLDLTEHLYAQFSRGNQYGQEIGEQALDYIHLHLTDPIRIEDLCERFHTNHTTLSIRFKKLTGYSITD